MFAFSFRLFFIYRDRVVGCAKHYVGDGGTINGKDEDNTVVSWHELLSIHMPAYYDSVIKGVASIMVSYSSWNGVKMHTHRDLVTGFLKNKLRFRVSPFFFFSFFLIRWVFVPFSYQRKNYNDQFG